MFANDQKGIENGPRHKVIAHNHKLIDNNYQVIENVPNYFPTKYKLIANGPVIANIHNMTNNDKVTTTDPKFIFHRQKIIAKDPKVLIDNEHK